VTNLEEVNLGKGRHRRMAIIVTELPYQVNKASLIEKIAELVNAGKIQGIADLRDESDREGIRIVIELRRDGEPAAVLEKLYRMTPLQSNFGAIFLALTDKQPKQMSLRVLLQEFLSFREVTLTRRYRHELTQAENRIHLVEGWITALDNIDAVISILRNAPDGSSAKLEFQNQFDFSDRQADAILAMPLRRLTGMERQNLNDEFAELTTKIAELNKLLSDRRELLKALKKELRSLRKEFADARRTRIIPTPIELRRRRLPTPAEAALPNTPMALLKAIEAVATPIDGDNNLELSGEPEAEAPAPKKKGPSGVINFAPIADVTAKSVSVKTAKALQLIPDDHDGDPVVLEFLADNVVRRLTPKAFKADRDVSEDVIIQTEDAVIGQTLVVLTNTGKAYGLSLKTIPRIEEEADGVPIIQLLPNSAQSDTVVSYFFLPTSLDDQFLLLLTQQGRIKRLAATELTDLGNRGVGLIKCKDDDQLAFTSLVNTGDQVVIATSSGRVLRLEANDQLLPATNKAAAGIQAMRVLKSETLVGLAVTGTVDPVLLISQTGYAKRMTTQSIKLSLPGELGTHLFQFSAKTDRLAALTTAFPDEMVIVITGEGAVAELNVDDVELASREHKGYLAVELDEGDRIERVYPQLLFAAT
jgi:DNA gyrase subunit A